MSKGSALDWGAGLFADPMGLKWMFGWALLQIRISEKERGYWLPGEQSSY